MENFNKKYPPASGFVNWIQGQKIRLYSDDSRRSVLYINGVNPPDQAAKTIDPAIWDILSYAGIPTDTITAYANYLYANGISTVGLGSYDVTRTFDGSTNSRINLPNSISYINADKGVSGYSGIDAFFGWHFDSSNNTALRFWPQAKIQYATQFQDGFPSYHWTNYGWCPAHSELV